jgi:hypothetical protein
MSCLADGAEGQHRLLFDLNNNGTVQFLENLYSFKV